MEKKVNITVVLSKDITVTVPENATESEIVEKAKLETVMPMDSIRALDYAMRQLHIYMPSSTDSWQESEIRFAISDAK